MPKTFNRPVKLGGHKRVINSITVQILQYDGSGNALLVSGVTTPTGAGYAKGCLFMKTDAATSVKGLYENVGTTTAASFNLIGDVTASEITLAEGSLLVGNSSGVAAALAGKTTTQILIGNGTTVVSVAVSGDITITNAGVVTLADDAVSVENLDDGILPSHVVKYAGKITWSDSGATFAETVSGVAATDIVQATIQTKPSQAAYIVGVVPTTDTITVELSAANTSNDAVIAYSVLRAAA